MDNTVGYGQFSITIQVDPEPLGKQHKIIGQIRRKDEAQCSRSFLIYQEADGENEAFAHLVCKRRRSGLMSRRQQDL